MPTEASHRKICPGTEPEHPHSRNARADISDLRSLCDYLRERGSALSIVDRLPPPWNTAAASIIASGMSDADEAFAPLRTLLHEEEKGCDTVTSNQGAVRTAILAVAAHAILGRIDVLMDDADAARYDSVGAARREMRIDLLHAMQQAHERDRRAGDRIAPHLQNLIRHEAQARLAMHSIHDQPARKTLMKYVPLFERLCDEVD